MINAKGKVNDFMIKDITYTVTLDSTALEAIIAINKLNTTWVPVVEKGKFLGLLTLEAINKAYINKLRELQAK
jgi:predicted transcriptional regulator